MGIQEKYISADRWSLLADEDGVGKIVLTLRNILLTSPLFPSS